MQSEGLPLPQAQHYIENLNFSRIIDKMVSHQGWLRSEAEATCELYRHFLFLQKKYPEHAPLPPSEDIDEFWHAHILDTEKYHQDCQIIFGKYAHHYPYFGIDEKTTAVDGARAFALTQQLHQKEFGEPIYATRSFALWRQCVRLWQKTHRLLRRLLMPLPHKSRAL